MSTACVSLEWGGTAGMYMLTMEMKLGWLSPAGAKSRETYRDVSFCAVFPCASSISELNPLSSQACVMQRWCCVHGGVLPSPSGTEPRQVLNAFAGCLSSDPASASSPTL